MNITDDRPKIEAIKLDCFLPYRLSVLSNTVSNAIADIYRRRFDLSIWQWRVMCIVADSNGMSATQIAERTAMDKVAVSRAVKGLLAAGRLERTPSATDGRSSVLSLSRKGKDVYEEVKPLAMDYERRLLKGIGDKDRKEIDRLVMLLMERAKTL